MAHYTADGHEIKSGLVVWNNDLRITVVLKADKNSFNDPSGPWYDTTGRGYSNGDRMAVRHPSTRKLATMADVPEAERTEYAMFVGKGLPVLPAMPETVRVTLTMEMDVNVAEWVAEYGIEPTLSALKDDLDSYFMGSQPYTGPIAHGAVVSRITVTPK